MAFMLVVGWCWGLVLETGGVLGVGAGGWRGAGDWLQQYRGST